MIDTTPVVALQVHIFWSRARSGNSEKKFMATTLAPVDSREVVRGDHCHLVQFRTNNHLCRKCRASLDEEPPVPILMEPPAPEPATQGNSHLHIASAIRMFRQKSGLSQRQLALR